MGSFHEKKGDIYKSFCKQEPVYLTTCISANIVIGSCSKEVYKEDSFEIPFCNLQDCISCQCFPVPGTERIISWKKKPTIHSLTYKVFLRIAKTFRFILYCRTGDVTFYKELIIPASFILPVNKCGYFRLTATVLPINCKCSVNPGGSIAQYRGNQPQEQFGYALAYNPEPSSILVGSPSACNNNKKDAGKLTALSFQTGDTLFEKYGESQDDNLGFSISAGAAVDGVTLNNILSGAPWNGEGFKKWAGLTKVISGINGSTLLDIPGNTAEDEFGWSVCKTGDLDRDGVSDFLIGAQAASPAGKINAGSIFAVSGASGGTIYRLDGENPGDAFGYAIISIGDIDGDSIPDFAVSAPFASPSGLYQGGKIYVYSGLKGTLLYKIEGEEYNAGLGFSLSAMGDINGDGIPDFAAGAPDSSPEGRSEAGSVYIFSGKDGSVLQRFDGPIMGEECGISVSVIGDLDNDGKPDLAVGAPSASSDNRQFAGKVYLISANSCKVLQVMEGKDAWSQFGWSVASTGKPDSNAIFIGSPGNDSIYIYKYGVCKIECKMNLRISVTALQEADIFIPAAIQL